MPPADRPRLAATWRRYLRLWGEDVAADVDDEVRFHLEMRIRDYIAAGMSPAAAREEALRRFGDPERVKATCRAIGEARESEMRRSQWVEALGQDIKYGVRQLITSPVLSLVAIVTLALGIGANTAIFSVYNTVVLRPLPYADADRMTIVYEQWKGMNGGVAPAVYADWREQNRAFEDMTAFMYASFNLGEADDPERVLGARVTSSFFRVGYMKPALGRYLLPENDQAGRDHVVVLSYPLWERRFAADRGIIGREIPIGGEKYTVVGVTPRAYTLTPEDVALWVPLVFTPEQHTDYGAHYLAVFGKLKRGVTLAQAQREMLSISAGERQKQPLSLKDRSVRVASYQEELVTSSRQRLLVLLGAVAFVLLIACSNVANLLLAKAAVRQKEIAIRTALGAGRGRLVRQFITESVVLALVGGVAALAVGYLGIHFLVRVSPPGVPRLADAGLSPEVLGYTFALAVVCGVVFGLAPALRATRGDLQGTLKEGGKGSAMGTSRDRLRSVLVVSEVAIALVLLVAAGLLIRSAMLLGRVPPGFDPKNVLSVRLALPQQQYGDPARVSDTFRRIVEQVQSSPGVESAAAVSTLPLTGASTDASVRVEGRSNEPGTNPQGHIRVVTPAYFSAMHIAVRDGRVFTERDDAAAPRAIIINEAMAKRLWPGERAVGRRMSCCDDSPRDPRWREVVGVVADVRHFGLGEDVQPEMYFSYLQLPDKMWDWMARSMTLVVRSASNPAGLTTGVRRAVLAVDPMLPTFGVRTLEEVVSQSTAATRFNMLLLAMLGATGLVLAAVGIYGVIAYFVSQRTHEIGVRMALGASARDVLVLVVRQGATLALVGVAVGLVLAFMATRLLSSLLFGVTGHDPYTFAGVAVLLSLVALVASWIPARRATRVDPMDSLRAS